MAKRFPHSMRSSLRARIGRATAPGAVAGLLPWLLALPWAAGAQTIQTPPRALTYYVTNPGAGSMAHYRLLFPAESPGLLTVPEPWQLVFDANLNIDIAQKRLRFCYATDPAGRRPAHGRCVEPIPATLEGSAGPAQDRLVITPRVPVDPTRSMGLWVDLINPLTPGSYAIDLLRGSAPPPPAGAQPVGRWLIRIEHPSEESPGSSD